MSRKPLTSIARLALLSAAVCTTTAVACNNEEQSGDLVLNYNFVVGAAECVTEGVVTIKVTIGDISETEPCADTGEFNLNGIPAGNYSELLVEGIDAEGVTIRDNLDSPHTDESVEILGGASQTIEISMTPTPAIVELLLILLDPSGAPYIGQTASPVTAFTVQSIESGSSILDVSEIDVTQLQSNTVTVPDVERDILGDRLDRVNVEYTADGGMTVIDADPDMAGQQDFVFSPPGAGRKVTLRITCNGAVCTGELEGITEGSVTTGEDSATGTGGGADGSTGG